MSNHFPKNSRALSHEISTALAPILGIPPAHIRVALPHHDNQTFRSPEELYDVQFVVSLNRPVMRAPGTRVDEPNSAEEIAQTLRLVDQAEAQNEFVSLKWFRDTFLPRHLKLDDPADTLNFLIEEKALQAYKVANPKGPYETTAIRLNRAHELVRSTLT